MRMKRAFDLAAICALIVSMINVTDALGRELKKKAREEQPVERLHNTPLLLTDFALQKTNRIVENQFAVHDRGLQWLFMANFGVLSNPNDRPAGPPTPFHPRSSQRDSDLEYPGGSGTTFLFSGGLWVGAIKNGRRIVTTTVDGDDGTREVGPLSAFQFQTTDEGAKENDDDGDWNAATDDLNGDGIPSNDWDGPEADANNDGVFDYDPEPHIDEDPVGDISRDFLDNDHDGLIDEADDDLDGDKVPGSNDDDGDGLEDEDTLARGGQEWYTTYVDTCANCLSSPDVDGFTPLGVRIVQHTVQWAESFRDDFLVAEFLVTNIGTDVLQDVWLATFFDFDILTPAQGRAGSEDDITFFIDSLQTAIGCDDDGVDLAAQCFGVRVLQTPREGAGFSYLNFNRLTGGDPNDNVEKYVKMSSGVRDPDQFVNGDWRFLFSFGPLGNVAPGETLPVTLTIVNGFDLDLIATNARQAKSLFDNDFRGPTSPDAPTFTLTPLDRAVRVTWDSRAENSIDPVTRTFDFEGYRVWRSPDGQQFTLAAEFDLVNDIGLNTGLPPKNADGLYEFTDEGVTPLVQTIYVVTSFDNGDNGDGINHPELDRANGGIPELESSRGVTRQKVAVASSSAKFELEEVYVTPNPYVGSSRYEEFGRFDKELNRTFPKTMQFVNLPPQATIKIFTLAGELVQTLEHNDGSGVETWNLRTRLSQEIVAGIYLYHVQAQSGEQKVGKFVVVK